ncbi:hypothetical protein C8J57DRAFT_1529865 [Mycena rebaudengoi]|nr:hypothetical protein C8J57DRAFT_1529865 [Mycena rebaudengoi]
MRILFLSEPLQLLHHPLALTLAGLELRSWQLLALHDIDTHPPIFPALALFFAQLGVLEVKSQVSLTTAHSLRSSCEDSTVLRSPPGIVLILPHLDWERRMANSVEFAYMDFPAELPQIL